MEDAQHGGDAYAAAGMDVDGHVGEAVAGAAAPAGLEEDVEALAGGLLGLADGAVAQLPAAGAAGGGGAGAGAEAQPQAALPGSGILRDWASGSPSGGDDGAPKGHLGAILDISFMSGPLPERYLPAPHTGACCAWTLTALVHRCAFVGQHACVQANRSAR